MKAPKGSIINDATAVGWRLVMGSFDVEIDWLLRQGLIAIDIPTGRITVAGLAAFEEASHLPNGTGG